MISFSSQKSYFNKGNNTVEIFEAILVSKVQPSLGMIQIPNQFYSSVLAKQVTHFFMCFYSHSLIYQTLVNICQMPNKKDMTVSDFKENEVSLTFFVQEV